ncbi:MAG: replicative DNA helicase [Pseudomonadota bacterium]
MVENQSLQKKSNKAMRQVRVPPHSIEAEQSVLGGLMLDANVWDKIIEFVSEADFYQPNHKLIFQAISQLVERNQPIDVVTVIEALRGENKLKAAGDEVYLYELANTIPSAANVNAYAQIVRERSILRQLIEASHEIADESFQPEGRDSREILDRAEQRVFAIAEQTNKSGGPTIIQQVAAKAYDRIDNLFHNKGNITGLATGYVDLDAYTSGLQKSDLIIIAGRPSMGKTILGLNIAEYAAIKYKQNVLVFSLEMPAEALAMRLFSSLGNIDQQRIRTGRLRDQDAASLASAMNILAEAKIFIDDTPGLSPTEMRSRARRVMREQGELGLIVIDYLQLMRVPGLSNNRVAEISEISRSIKSLARELDVPVIALSQLNRSLESRQDKRPMMSDLRESGAIEQDADVITFIYRDEVYHPDSADKGIAELIIAKQRNGPIGKIRLTFKGNIMRFENYESNRYMHQG